MSDKSALVWPEGDDVRRLVPVFALVVAVVATLADRSSSSADLILAAIPVAAFALWALVPGVPLLATAVGVVVPVVVAQRSRALEPLLFDVSLLAFVGGRWSHSFFSAALVGVLAAAAPVVGAVIQDPAELAVGIWLLGIVCPWFVGLMVARQLQLAVQLDETRRELSEQALLAERRRTARDFHDAVGHGLAAVMLQITSARHVLHRDPAAAEEALRSAEDVGRQSMRELRRTVALLRSEEAAGASPAGPSAGEVRALVENVRAAGLCRRSRDPWRPPADRPQRRGRDLSHRPGGARNAARHARDARTLLRARPH